VAPTKFLNNSGTDTFWGRILGNGGDWFELVVIQDHLDLRGWRTIVSDNAGALVTTLTFSNASILSDLRSGTIITISADLPSDVSYNPYGGDWWINLRAGTSGDGLYISNLSFSISQTNTQITILDATGAVAFGPAGEGINPASGIGNDEIWKLQEDPGPTTTPFANYQDGTTSTFGSANLWSGGAGVQSLSALRNPVVVSCTTAGQCADANPCTDDACVGGHCQNTANTASCDDGNACTSGDTCANRVCGSGATVPGCCFGDCECNDGNACTEGDSCQAGACAPGAAVSCDDGNVCTYDACNPTSGSCVATTSGACGIGGTVYYYRDDDGSGSEPSAKVVPNVGIDRTQDAVADATTDENGSYALGGVSGDLTVTTVPKFGSPRASDHNDGISSFDASVIGRAAAQLLTLSPNQAIAGDVTGDGTISAFDASFVGRFAAGLVDHFDVATAHGSDWAFLRCDAYAFPGAPGCAPPAHVFAPIAQPESGRNFFAILYGDVTGNWSPAAGLAASARASSPEERAAVMADRQASERVVREVAATAPRRAGAGPAGLSLSGWNAGLAAGKRRQLTIDARDADGILGLDLKLRFDPSRVAIVAVSAAGIGSGANVAHSERSGTCRIAAYGVVPLSGSGPVLQVTVEALKPLGPQAPLGLTGLANEGRIPLVIGGRHAMEPSAR
jgi:hypothetical protein